MSARLVFTQYRSSLDYELVLRSILFFDSKASPLAMETTYLEFDGGVSLNQGKGDAALKLLGAAGLVEVVDEGFQPS